MKVLFHRRRHRGHINPALAAAGPTCSKRSRTPRSSMWGTRGAWRTPGSPGGVRDPDRTISGFQRKLRPRSLVRNAQTVVRVFTAAPRPSASSRPSGRMWRGHRGLRQRPGHPGGRRWDSPASSTSPTPTPASPPKNAGQIRENGDAGRARRQEVLRQLRQLRGHRQPGAGRGTDRGAGVLPKSWGWMTGRWCAVLWGAAWGPALNKAAAYAGPKREKRRIPAHPRLWLPMMRSSWMRSGGPGCAEQPQIRLLEYINNCPSACPRRIWLSGRGP